MARKNSFIDWIGRLLLGCFLWLILVRLVRYFYKFPIPEFMTPLIDNPARRKIQPPEVLARRHGLQPGMTVLEIGPGNGAYTLAAARLIGPSGRLVTIDIARPIIERLLRRLKTAEVSNVAAHLASVYTLPFETAAFDAIFMVTVIGEIPEPGRAMREFHRVLKPGGVLALSELLIDPDYPRPRTLINLAHAAGFRLEARCGNLLAYTLRFVK